MFPRCRNTLRDLFEFLRGLEPGFQLLLGLCVKGLEILRRQTIGVTAVRSEIEIM